MDLGGPLHVGAATLQPPPGEPRGATVEIAGEPYYRVENCDLMPPFLMSLASDSDHWLFISSTGALTAGRRDPDHALFPYTTDDRIHDSRDQTGGTTLLRVRRDGCVSLWEPFSARHEHLYRRTRSLAKSIYGNKLLFEEHNHDLGLIFSCHWMTSERFGLVRRSTLTNAARQPVAVDVIDGVQNLLPAGLTRRFQLEFSTLADAYKDNELDPATGLGLIRLSSIPVDRPEPNEALRATTVWSDRPRGRKRRLFRRRSSISSARAQPLSAEAGSSRRTRRLLLCAELSLDCARPGGEWLHRRRCWEIRTRPRRRSFCAPVQLRSATVWRRDRRRRERSTCNLMRLRHGGRFAENRPMRSAAPAIIATHYSTSCAAACSRRLSDRRGGFHGVRRGRQWRRGARHAEAFLVKPAEKSSLRPDCWRGGLSRRPGLERLAHEYLPLTFSRRHGDPSRPWNNFSIRLRGADGSPRLNYEGNWRDIFQNWEALALSFPGYALSMICQVSQRSRLPTATIRIASRATGSTGKSSTRTSLVLHRLLGRSPGHLPAAAARTRGAPPTGILARILGRRLFTYCNIPYRIRSYAELLRDPHRTIDFDAALDRDIRERVAAQGGDAAALTDRDGAPYRGTLAEKLLVVLLARLFNFVPEAGVWMNTQRPEWNDANNALVGRGMSVVTLCYLRRFVSFCRDLFAAAQTLTFDLSAHIAHAQRRVAAALQAHVALLEDAMGDRDRKRVLDALGEAGGEYRAAIYARGLSGERATLAAADAAKFCDLVLRWLDHSIAANRRADGLYHGYNLMRLEGDGIAIDRLDEMLEAQVAVLSSGTLGAAQALAVLDALRDSRLYRADQMSYLLNPDRQLPGFLEKNNIAPAELEKSPLLRAMIARGERRIVVVDHNGGAHFNADMRNAAVLQSALAAAGVSAADGEHVLEIYERVFAHRSFTGRSGTFFKYEGLGCIYWHMVSKLLLAVQEMLQRAVRGGAEAALVERLREHYRAIRDGLGVHKPPSLYGAIPTDPYSHTPGFAGVQQPGMTGQVKEDLISRLGEMGVLVCAGRLEFHPEQVNRDEFLAARAASAMSISTTGCATWRCRSGRWRSRSARCRWSRIARGRVESWSMAPTALRAASRRCHSMSSPVQTCSGAAAPCAASTSTTASTPASETLSRLAAEAVFAYAWMRGAANSCIEQGRQAGKRVAGSRRRGALRYASRIFRISATTWRCCRSTRACG